MTDGRLTKREQYDRKNFLFGIDGEIMRFRQGQMELFGGQS